ncbi:Tripartite tricarboxylate transporter TctB family protein [Tranquillimonas rosea]|uniref:Tripartite tricarboxylate transporter TctB family protein n=1 Tax=Tranquillimonas rosea TaxID=641238 RepID=A0A1H9WR93_9RHOB|nr:tripartite tricarboxylate transporter TctB family protein [Tranquillimonas rosea]SES36450.1 Tripartite tricarboxylate transporter TctB family protein [Tranquillimonas rosea]
MTARLYSFVAATALAGSLFLWLALQLPGGEEVTTLIGPRTWPLLILVILLALVVVMVVLLAARGPEQFVGTDEPDAPQDEVVDEAVQRDDASGFTFRHLGVLAATVAYSVAMEYTGYLVATAIFAAVATMILGERKPLRIVLTTGVAVALVAVVFDQLLNIPLP